MQADGCTDNPQAFFPKIKMGPKWDAFGHVMKHKGLPLIIMIRYSPIPWAIGNGLFAVCFPAEKYTARAELI